MAYDKVVDSSVLDAGLKQIADAIREKGGTSDNLAFPTAMAEAIAAIDVGGNVMVETGSVTLSEDVTSYTFVDGSPDVLIVFSGNEEKPIHTARKGLIAMVRMKSSKRMYFIGYNNGTKNYYMPYFSVSVAAGQENIGYFSSGIYNSRLLASASPYIWYAIWGVE